MTRALHALLGALALAACDRPAERPDAPTVALSADALSFALPLDGASRPAEQSIVIRNAGSGTLAVPAPSIVLTSFPNPAGAAGGWLEAAVVADPEGYRLLVRPTVRSGDCFLPQGDYLGTVVLDVPGAANSPRTVQVRLSVPPPDLAPPPATLSFTAPLDGSEPPEQVVQIVNRGGYARPHLDLLAGDWVTGQAVAVPDRYGTFGMAVRTSAALLDSWGHAGPATKEVGLYALPAPGTAHEQRYLLGWIQVTLDVPPPHLEAATAELAFRARAGEPHFLQTLFITNTGRRTGAAIGLLPWPRPADGYFEIVPTASTSPWSFEVRPQTEGVAPGVYTTSLVASLEYLGGNRVAVPVTITIDPPLLPHLAPPQLSFHAIAGRSPPPQTAVLTVPGGQGFGITTLQPEWLRSSVLGAESPHRIVVSPASAALPVGSYSGSVDLQGDLSWTESLPVALEVGHWQPTGSLAGDRSGHATVALADGRVLAVGGYRFDPWRLVPLDTTELYDPVAGTWSAGPALLHPRTGHTATLLADGRILVAGRCDAVLGAVADAEILDLQSGTSTALGLRDRRCGDTATLLADGRVLLAGSWSAEIFDPASDGTSPAGSPGVEGAAAVRLASGKVLLAGSKYAPESGCALFDPDTGAWSSTGAMAVPRQSPRLLLLPDGRALALGGGDRSLEVYDPDTGSWSPFGQVPGLGYALAALRMGGKVLVADAAAGRVGAAIDLLDPATGAWESQGFSLPWVEGMAVTPLQDGTALASGFVFGECQLWGVFR